MKKQLPTIIECKIGPYPRKMPEGMLDPMPKVKVKFSDGKEQVIFDFYPDEISFNESDFIGLTLGEAMNLKNKKVIEYIKK